MKNPIDGRRLKSNGKSLAPDERDSTHFKPQLAPAWGRQEGQRLVSPMKSSGGSGDSSGGLQ